MTTRFYHAGLVTQDAAKLARFDATVFHCTDTGDHHDIGGADTSRGTGLPGAHLVPSTSGCPGTAPMGAFLRSSSSLRWSRAYIRRIARPDALGVSVDDVGATLALLIAEDGQALGEGTALEVENVGTAAMVYDRDP